jgi:hypothetical protein
LAFLAAFFAFFAIGLIPPFRLELRKVDAAPPWGVCRLALSPRVPAPLASFSREPLIRARSVALWQLAKGIEKRWGSAWKATAPLQSGQSYFFFAFLAFLAAFFAFFAIGLIPPFRLGYAEGAAAPPRRFCRLALSPRVPAPSRLAARVVVSRAMFAPSGSSNRAEEKVGQCSRETAPLQSGLTYFFFAFLAFLAAFFAFLAIVPPEGVRLCLMATSDVVH